jgi:hypothetical protein
MVKDIKKFEKNYLFIVCISSIFDEANSGSIFPETSSAKHHFILSEDT